MGSLPGGGVAQLEEHLTGSQKVVGSSPITSTPIFSKFKDPYKIGLFRFQRGDLSTFPLGMTYS